MENLPLCSLSEEFDGPTAKAWDDDEPCFGELVDAENWYCQQVGARDFFEHLGAFSSVFADVVFEICHLALNNDKSRHQPVR